MLCVVTGTREGWSPSIFDVDSYRQFNDHFFVKVRATHGLDGNLMKNTHRQIAPPSPPLSYPLSTSLLLTPLSFPPYVSSPPLSSLSSALVPLDPSAGGPGDGRVLGHLWAHTATPGPYHVPTETQERPGTRHLPHRRLRHVRIMSYVMYGKWCMV